MNRHNLPPAARRVFPWRLCAVVLLCLASIHAADRSENTAIETPFGKAYLSVRFRHENVGVLFYVIISKRRGTPPIQEADLKVQVRDKNGRPLACTPTLGPGKSLIEVESAGASANAIYTVTVGKNQQPQSATVTWLGKEYEFPAVEWWDVNMH